MLHGDTATGELERIRERLMFLEMSVNGSLEVMYDIKNVRINSANGLSSIIEEIEHDIGDVVAMLEKKGEVENG